MENELRSNETQLDLVKRDYAFQKHDSSLKGKHLNKMEISILKKPGVDNQDELRQM